ncbi:uncharacterized protein Tco025E_04358 [Trypanosoma conorhini]|uniref:Uncharacterized protein n=1 Tax=Trypanosoma conorhini TaxID=83891 RepID=A0A422PN86_9TRYP|nr:uncharacterized protein Tco025E_04358 [Trypanosoma conorhini]RNF19179.1 hypothetical protein Tco025E_04358 [Trypanosoma conorhini]
MWSQKLGGGALAVSLLHQQRRHQSQYQQQDEGKTAQHSCVDESNGESTSVRSRRSPASTYTGVRVKSYVLSPVFEEHHSLWQWRTVVWREKFHAVPFFLHCAPGVPLRHPFLHHTLVEHITRSSAKGRVRAAEPPTPRPGAGAKQRCAQLLVPSPIGMLAAAASGASDCHPTAEWVDGLFCFLERGAAQTVGTPSPSYSSSTYTDVFKCSGAKLPFPGGEKPPMDHEGGDTVSTDPCESKVAENVVQHRTHRVWHASGSVPLEHRNVIGCGLAEVVLAIDRYAAMLARREITYAKACWAVLVDSKADVQPHLRSSAVAIEEELLAATAAHEAMTAAMGDPVRRPLLRLADYPALARW